MANGPVQNVSIKINISGKHLQQLQVLAESVQTVTRRVHALQQAIYRLGQGSGAGQNFSSSKLIESLGEIKTAIAAIKDAKFENVSKAIDSLNDAKITNFAKAVGLLKGNLDTSLVQQITSFGNAIQAMGTAQGKFNGAMLVKDIKDLMTGLGQLNISANQTQNISNLKDALSGLSIPLNPNTIAALSQLGFALRNIREYAEGKNVLSSLASGIKQFSKLKEVDGLLHNVRKLAAAAQVLNRADALDFTNFTKGLLKVKELNDTVTKDDWSKIGSVVTSVQKAFAPLDKMKLPNLSGLATVVSTLTARDKDGNIAHDMELFGKQVHAAAGHILEAFTPLKHLKMPQLGGIAKNLDILSTATYNFKNIEAIVKRFKETLGTLHGLQMPNLNNFAKGLNELQKLKTGVSVRGTLGDDIASLKKDLMGWENIKVPNLASFAKGLKDLAAGTLDTKTISENLKAIPNKLKWLTGIQVPDLSGFAKGIHELSRPTVDAGRAATAIGAAIDAIHTNLAGKGEIKFPGLATFAKGIKEFHVLAETGKTDEENLKKIVTPIKTLITELQSVGKVDLPNLNGIAVAIHKLSTAVPADAGTTAAGHITAITAAVKGLDKIQVPDLTKISKAFETLNKSYVNYYTSGATGKYGSSFEHITEAIKKSLDSLKGIQVPNLSGIASAFKALNSNLLKEETFSIGKFGLQSQSSRYIDRNIEAIKEAVIKLGEVGNVKLPDLRSVVSAFKTLNTIMVSGGITDDYGNRVGDNLSRNIHAIKNAVTQLSTVSDVNLPNLSGIASAFKVLNTSVLREFSNTSTKETTNAIQVNAKALQDALAGFKDIKVPTSMSGLTSAFKTLNESMLYGATAWQKGAKSGEFTSNIQKNLSELKTALEGYDKISVPNLKQLADGLKNIGGMDLPTRGIFGMGGTKLENNIKVLKSALSMLDGYKIPNVAQLAKGITEIANFDIPTSKSFLGIKWGDKLKENIGSFNAAIKDIKGTTVPNAAQLAEGIKILSGEGINGTVAAGHITAVTAAIQGLNKTSVPNLKPFADGLLTLNEIPRRALKETHLKGIFDTIKRAIGDFGETRLPALDSLAKGVKNLSSESANADIAAQKITALAKAIHGGEGSPGLANVTIPNLNSIANVVGTLGKEVKKAEEITPSKGLLSGVVSALKKGEKDLEQAAQDKSASGALQTNLKALQDGLQGFNDLRVPSIAHIANAFKILNESALRGPITLQKNVKPSEFTTNIERNVDAIKAAVEKFRGLEGIKIPKLTDISDAFKVLNENGLKRALQWGEGGKYTVLGDTYLDKNIAAIKKAINDLREVQNVKIPDLTKLASGFKTLGAVFPEGKTAYDFNRFEVNTDKIKAALEKFKEVKDVTIPNLTPIAKAFRELDSAVPSGKKNRMEEGWLDTNVKAIIQAVKDLGTVGDVKLPKIKNIGDAFKTLNESVNKVGMFDGRGNWTGYATRVQAAVKALHEAVTSVNWDGIKLPNVKNIADAFKTLNGEVLQHVTEDFSKNKSLSNSGITAIQRNLQALKDAFTKVDFSEIKLPNIKNVADAFKTLNSIEKLETVPDGTGTQSRVKHYVDEIARAFQSANTTLKDVKLPNIKNVADAFKTLNSIEVKDNKDSNFVQNLKKVWEQLRVFKRDTELQDIKFPNFKNIADAFRTLDTVLKPSDKIDTGKFDENVGAVKRAIEKLREFDKLKLPNLKSIADAFKILNESVLVGWTTPGKGTVTRVQQNVDEIIQALTKIKDTEVIKLPNLKNIADAFNILGTIPKGMSQDNRIDTFKTNINTIISVLEESKDKLNKIQLPNLKNIADAFVNLSGFKPKDLDIIAFRANVTEIKNALSDLYSVTKDTQGKQLKLPNLEGLAKAFKILNSEELKSGFKWEGGKFPKQYASNLEHNIRAIVAALKEFEGKNFDLPNINNLAAGLQKLNKISEINGNLSENMGKLKEGLEVLRGVQVPKQFKNFADGLHSLQEFSTKATGQLINDKLAQDLAALATSLRQFTGITLPTNLQGFAKGIEAVAKVNVQDFTTKFNQLMQAMKSLNLDPNTTALDHLTAKLAVCAAGIYAVENKLRQASASFAGFGGSTKPAEDGLSRLQERIKMFLQYRVISTLFNKLTTAIQAIPNNIKEFEKSMYNVQSITGATDVTVSKLGITVKEIASTTKFSAQEVADGMTMIAQAGFTAGQSMQMMQSISNLATGTLSDMKTVVDLVTSAMVVFNIESNDAARVSDVFANAVNKSKLTMDKIKTAFNYIGPIARDANVSFEESAVAMMLLANSGQKASTIGTGLRNVFATLLSPSKKLTEAAAAVGVSLTDLDPRVNSFKDVISNLGIVVRDSQVALDVFGKRGSTAVLSLTNGAKDFDRLYSAVTRVGSAAEMASKQQEGLYVRWKNLTDRAQLLAVTLGQNGVTGAISALVNAISGLINWLNSWNNNWVGRTLLRFGMLSAALTSFAAVIISVRAIWAPFVTAMTNGMINLVGLFPKVSAGAKTAAAGIAATSAAAQAGTAATVTFGTALRALLAAAWPLIAVFTTLSFVFSAASVDAESVQNRLQNISQELDKIENQTHSLQAALDKIAKTREGTSEYANAIKSLMQALLENKGAVVGAEDEFRALQRSINDTSDGFNDGGKAVANYMSRLKELAAVQANMASADSAKLLRKVMPRARDMAYDVRKELGLEVEYKRTGNATLGQIIREDEVTFDQIKEIVRKVSEGIWSAEQVGIRDWSKFIDRYKTARENAEKFIDKYKDMGKLSLYDTIENVQTLAQNLNKTEDEVKAILSVFKEMQDVEFGKNFSGVLPSDVQNAMRNLPEVELDIKANLDVDATKISKELDKIKIPSDAIFAAITAAREDLAVVSKENKTNINYTDDDVKKATQITERFRQISEYAKKFKEEYQSAMAKTASISDVTERERRRYELQQKSLVVQKALRIETDKVMVARNESENVAALTRGLEVQLEKQRDLASIEQRIADIRSRGAEQHRVELEQITKLNREIAATDDKSERTKLEGDVAKLQERIRDRARANQKEIADLEAQSATILEKYFERYSALTRAGEPVEEFVKKLLKADKEEQKIRDIQLQRDLNRIHILEEAYKQSNGRIGLDFKQSRAAEQEAFAKDLASKLVAIDNMEKKIKAKYSLSTNEEQAKQYTEQLKIIQQQRDKALEDAYKSQFDLQQKYAKAAMFAAKEAGDKIEKEAKRASEARKREQEKAMHDIALLEAKGVISHEEAERQKAEVSIKYHGELIAAYRKQIEDLKNVGAADNIQQIVRLEEEIAKSSYDAIKEARKGIEEQNKSIYESIKKLEEIQGSKDLDRGAGDFSLERQRKITEEYAEEIEKRKKFEKEGVDYVTEVQYDSMSKVAEAVRKHYDKVDSIRSKSAEKQETLEKDMVKKQEEYEKKKFDIKQKYNKKEVDLANERQDVLDQLETDGDSKRLSRRKLYRANERIANAENQINEATAAGDKQTLEAIANQLKSDTGTLLGAEKPRVHGGAILRAFELRKQILAAQKQIELAEEEKKFQRELERDKRRLSILKDSAEQALLAENGRHELAMEHLEKEAEKMREKIRLAQELIKLQKEALEDAKVQLEAQPITGKPSESAQSNVPQAITKREDGKYANVPPVLGTQMEEKGEKKFVPKQPIQQTPAQQVPVQGKGALPTNMPGTWQRAVSQVLAGAPGLSDEQRDKTLAYVEMVFGKAQEAIGAVQAASSTAVEATATTAQASAESATTALTTVQEKAKEAKEDADITKEKAATHLSDSSKERVNASDPAKMAEAAKKAGLQVTAEGVATNLYNPEEAKKSAEEVAKIDADFRERVKQAADRMNEDNKKAAEGFEQDFKIAVDSVSNLIGLLEGRVQDVQQYVKDNPIVFVSNAEESQARIDDVFELITQYINDKFDSINVPIGIDEDSAKKGIEFLREDVTYLVRDAYKLVVEGKVDDAIRKLQGIKAELDKLKDKEITVTVEKVEKNSTGGTVPAYSTGGQVYRRLQSRFINTGSGNKDDVPALLMKNEFVHRAAAVKKYGVDFMYKLNNLQIPASITKMFASGGLVSNAVGAVHKFANGGLIRSTKRKLEELFAGSGVNLNVDNLNITGKMEEAANQFTSPIGIQAMGMLAKNIESGIAKFVVGGPISNAALTSAQIRNISAAYSSSIAKAQASGNAAIAQAMTEERKRLYDLSDELQAILASLNEEYNTEARKLTDEHKQKLKEKKEEYDKNVEEENTSYNEKVESDTKSYEKEDKDYAKSKSERDTNYQESLQELKDSLEKDRLDYEANLLSKQQAVLEREAAIQNFRNQLNSERYPVGSSQHSSASIEELIYAHAEYAKKKYGSDRMYIIDMGGTISQPNLSDEEKKAELQRLKEAIRPMSRGQRDSLNRAYTKAYNSESRYFYDYLKQADNLKAFYNKERGYTAYREAVARAEGELEEIPMEQSIPYYTYLMQHLRSDYTLPMQQAALELQSAMTEDTPDTRVSKEINKLTKEYKEATDEAEESRIESLEERKKNIAERETSHKDKLAELKKEYDDFVAEENKTYQESLAKLKEETETKVEDAKAGNYENIEIVKNNTADIIEYAKTKMRRSVAVARSDKERWLNNVQNAAREQANKNAADALSTANAYVPEYVSTEPKTGNAMSVAQGLLGGVDIDELLKKLRSGVLKFAKGGLVPLFRGAKAGTDSVLSLLSPHEFVMSAKAVKAFGVNFMNSLNNLKVPAFATGGMVGASTPVSESAIDKIVNKTVYALDLTLNNTHIGELMGEKDTIDSFMTAMNRARMGIA